MLMMIFHLSIGKALGKPASEIDIYKKRAYNYKNLFDKETG
jgi:putative alpha-1,2-mannosidase